MTYQPTFREAEHYQLEDEEREHYRPATVMGWIAVTILALAIVVGCVVALAALSRAIECKRDGFATTELPVAP